MKRGPKARVTIGISPVLILAATVVLSAPPALAAESGNPDTDPHHSRLVRQLGQCDFENGVARALGGAIRQVEPCEPPETPPETGFSRRLPDVKGKLRPPAGGALVRRFLEPDEKGQPSQGIVLRTQPGAQVRAPFDSVISFAQPYRDYGHLLILSTWDGYHFVLAGMTKIYGVEGQNLLEGEPVGVMGAAQQDPDPVPDAPLDAGTGDAPLADAGPPDLYFEIRKDGKPIDPLPWLATGFLERTSR